MLYWFTLWKQMRKLTHRDVEKRAVMELCDYFEKQIDKVIIQSEKEFERLNQLKEIQGLYQKSRIDKDCIQNAIKTINSNGHSPSSEKTGGPIEKKEKSKKHLPKKDFLTEVQ